MVASKNALAPFSKGCGTETPVSTEAFIAHWKQGVGKRNIGSA
jgi:hypothetical protein